MKDMVAVVVNGANGCGEAICRHLAEKGARVLATYQNPNNTEMMNAWQIEQKNSGYDIDVIHLDVTNFNACATSVKEIENNYQSIDLLVNNVDLEYDNLPCELANPTALHQTALKINLSGVFNITRHVINGMIARYYGRVINISYIDILADNAQVNYVTKTHIHAFTKCLAREIVHAGVTANTISAGCIGANLPKDLCKELRDKILQQIPAGRFGEAQDVARAVGFLAEKASGFITGSNLIINGGQTFDLN